MRRSRRRRKRKNEIRGFYFDEVTISSFKITIHRPDGFIPPFYLEKHSKSNERFTLVFLMNGECIQILEKMKPL